MLFSSSFFYEIVSHVLADFSFEALLRKIRPLENLRIYP